MPEIPDSAVQAAMARKADLLSDCPSPTALSEETLTRLMLEDAAEHIVMGRARADVPPAEVEIINNGEIIVRRDPDGSASIATIPLGGPSIALAPFEWRALCEIIRHLDRPGGAR